MRTTTSLVRSGLAGVARSRMPSLMPSSKSEMKTHVSNRNSLHYHLSVVCLTQPGTGTKGGCMSRYDHAAELQSSKTPQQQQTNFWALHLHKEGAMRKDDA